VTSDTEVTTNQQNQQRNIRERCTQKERNEEEERGVLRETCWKTIVHGFATSLKSQVYRYPDIYRGVGIISCPVDKLSARKIGLAKHFVSF
jgi:hypothetical protein